MRHMPEESFRAVIEVNLIGVWRTLRLSLPHVIERRGYLMPIASMAAIVPQFPGFVARSHKDELKCPDLELNVLQEIVDVTDQVNKAVKADLSPEKAAAAMTEASV